MLMNTRGLARICFIISIIFLILVVVTILSDFAYQATSAGLYEISSSTANYLGFIEYLLKTHYYIYYVGTAFLFIHTLLMLISIYKEHKWVLLILSLLIPPAPTLVYYVSNYCKNNEPM